MNKSNQKKPNPAQISFSFLSVIRDSQSKVNEVAGKIKGT